jgi:methionyl-tRNA synthetase
MDFLENLPGEPMSCNGSYMPLTIQQLDDAAGVKQERSATMYCTKCEGFMTVDSFIDMDDEEGQRWISAWRCVNCGQVTDPGVVRNRLNPRELVAAFVERPRTRRRPHAAPVPVRLTA